LIGSGFLFAIILAYLLLLFVLAYFAETREKQGKSIASNPYVYSLSFAVYCTSWTFYGSVGMAATSGLSFLTTYLGPTLMATLWWLVLRKIVVIAKEQGITTISDFIGSRYGKSLSLSALVTVVAVVGIMPYLGLQIKSIISTFQIISGQTEPNLTAGWLIVLFIGIFAIIFGARKLDSSERHEGLIFAIAFESLIKLVAFVAAGVFVTYGLFGGFGDILGRIGKIYPRLLSIGAGGSTSLAEWTSLTFLSMMAIMFLPRQFHVSVVENSSRKHILKAMWLFPLYLFIINIFVLPVAFGGLLLGGKQAQADSFVLSIPLSQGKSALALLVFLGGFSAATGMIIVESLALSTMVMNSLAMPFLIRFNRFRGFPSMVLNTKRLVILGCVFIGYLFAVSIGRIYSLADMGLNSFEAVTLFAPSLLIGLYWKGGNKKGAAAGFVGGFIVWFYTLLLPEFLKAGVIHSVQLKQLFATPVLNPAGLFGLKGLDRWSNSLFWSMLVNLGLYFGVSVFTKQSQEEEKQALIFVESVKLKGAEVGQARGLQTVDEIRELLGRYIGRTEAAAALESFITSRGMDRSALKKEEILKLREEAERILSGALGSAIATLILRNKLIMTEELSSSIRQISNTLKLSREKLEEANRELNFLKEFSQNIIESVPQGIATMDRDFKITYWNRGMENLTDVKRGNAVGRSVQEFPICIGPGTFAGMQAGEHICDTKPGYTLKVSSSPFKDPQGGYVLMIEDITEKKRRESELLQASKYASIGKLTAGISHEIGNPLASISSLVQEIQEVGQPEFTREALDIITHHIERIVRIVRSLGDFARLYSPEKVPSSIADILDNTLNLTRYDKKFKKIEIVKDIVLTGRMKMNPDQIQQVFLNLTLNALDAMPDGGRLTIKVKDAGTDVIIIFSDTGTGMDKKVVDRIFDPFYTTKSPGKGTGLGMSICWGIINEHGGTISVESKKGLGSTFTIRLPKKKEE
jgi:Na+/proline symporter/signal transduction histidine kinase